MSEKNAVVVEQEDKSKRTMVIEGELAFLQDEDLTPV